MSEFNFTPNAINERLKKETTQGDEPENIEVGGSDLALITQLMRVLVSGKPLTETEHELLTVHIKYVEDMDRIAKEKVDTPELMMRDLDIMLNMAKEHHVYVDETIKNMPPTEGNGIAKGVGILVDNIEKSMAANVKKFYRMNRIMRLIDEITGNDDDDE